MFTNLKAGLCAALTAASLASAEAEQLAQSDVQSAMRRVETALTELGVNVPGYGASAPPEAVRAPANHPYLRGNDGGYVAGKIYVSEEAIEDCVELTLVHELVHDATAKYRLFAAVPNERLRDMLEALADRVTEAAAEDPYRPGCLPHRSFEISSLDLASLAMSRPAR